MLAKMKLRMIVKKNLLMNRLALILLRREFQFYRIHSKPLVDSLSADAAWMSGIENEERHLDGTQRIIERRIHSAINKSSSKQR